MVAVPAADGLMVTRNAPVELFAGTVTVAGTVAMEVLLLAGGRLSGVTVMVLARLKWRGGGEGPFSGDAGDHRCGGGR